MEFLLHGQFLNWLSTLLLQQGVELFSSKANKNMPWRKILEFGHNVFHPNRTPAELKDKWRNIMAKEALNTVGNDGMGGRMLYR